MEFYTPSATTLDPELVGLYVAPFGTGPALSHEKRILNDTEERYR